ncbi:protein GVQW3-like [Octopus sinensis]|uniref:Protein GVQW3-like n=1 Tax=Octopus sinensis TaxID=2607531 RepID=A0A6P7SNE4_9MOLL|nr:protein GVQW3-like [Octopus sinensis]
MLPIDATAKCEVRTVIRFSNANGIKPIEIHRQLTEVYGMSCMDIKNCRKWRRQFAAGCTEIHDEERSGQPSISEKTVAKVEQILCENRRISLDDLRILVPGVSRSTIHRVVCEKLQYRKVCARWVPRMLTEDHKRQTT